MAEVVATIEGRLKELEEEKAELQRYMQLDKQRRALEYAMLDKELQELTKQLEKVGWQAHYNIHCICCHVLGPLSHPPTAPPSLSV